MQTTEPLQSKIFNDADVVRARRQARDFAKDAGLGKQDALEFARACGELAHNAWSHGGGGVVEMECVARDGKRGVKVTVRDKGPGIPDLVDALEAPRQAPATSTGLAGVELVMGPLSIHTSKNGTTISATKWESLQHRELRQRLNELI